MTKRPLSIQYATDNESGVISEFDESSFQMLRRLWHESEAVIFFNAPYDLGVLSIAYPQHHSYRWVNNKSGKYWHIRLFGLSYRVFRIGGVRNSIRAMSAETDINGMVLNKSRRRPKSTPVIDLLKLWSILVDDGEKHSISLKSLIERELHEKPIPYTPENALTREYQLQDVEKLRSLWSVFLERVSRIDAVSDYTYLKWSEVKTPATFTKIAYLQAYPDLKLLQRANKEKDSEYHVSKALEEAYHGGITIALKRGVSANTAWFDIHGAYAHTIEYENTDRYMLYHWEACDDLDGPLPRDGEPYLCKCLTDAVLASIGKSLKIYRLKQPAQVWMWSYDILALRLLFPDMTCKVSIKLKLCPDIPDAVSLPIVWSAEKEHEELTNGKTTLREFYKLLSNTSYGIKAQRNPYETAHTNMAIAGVITSRAHLILAEMIDVVQKCGCRWVYSDTDSICVEHGIQWISGLEYMINKRIAPYSAGCEGYGRRTKILSLKRYTSKGGFNIDGSKPHDKIRLHGKGQFKISQSDIASWTEGVAPPQTRLTLASVAANTERTMSRVIKLNPLCEQYKHPFMFETNCRADVSPYEWFMRWYAHVDTKTTYPESALVNDEFYRDIRTFETQYHAYSFYRGQIVSAADNPDILCLDSDYDNIEAYFHDS